MLAGMDLTVKTRWSREDSVQMGGEDGTSVDIDEVDDAMEGVGFLILWVLT